MFCPQCGSNQSDELKFCKACGANLLAVRKAVASPESVGKFDWNKTWLAEMLMSGEESVKRAKEIERLQGLTPEVKRRREIKAGVITASSGLALMVVLSVLMEGIIISGRISDLAAEILSRIWIVGLIPLLVGLALIINGMFVSKKSGESSSHTTDAGTKEFENLSMPDYLSPADTSQLASGVFSVTDETTKHLKEPIVRTKSSGE